MASEMTLHEFQAELARIAAGALPMVDAVVGRGAYNIKNDSRRRIKSQLSTRSHARAYPYSITYDLGHTPGTSFAVIGPDKNRRQGPLGNILEYGTRNNAPLPHLNPALDAEAPKFEAEIAKAARAMWDRK